MNKTLLLISASYWYKYNNNDCRNTFDNLAVEFNPKPNSNWKEEFKKTISKAIVEAHNIREIDEIESIMAYSITSVFKII